MTREYTTKILELLNEGDYSMECLLPDLLNWMSEDDVREFVINHDYLSTLVESEDEDEEFDNSGIDFITGILGKPSKSGLGLCWSGLANNGNTVTLFVPENDQVQQGFVPETILTILEDVYGMDLGDEATIH